jgi:hypothetical protein
MTNVKGLSRREFVGVAGAAAAAVMLPRCGTGSGPSGDHPPINISPIPAEQFSVMPADPYDDRRVVRVHDREVTTYGFGADEVAPLAVDPDVLQAMLEAALCDLARQPTVAAAWATLLPADAVALEAARIAIKINLNGDNPEFINTSPAMIIALARSLGAVGVAPEALTFFDRSRGVHDAYREAVEAAVPGVALLGGAGIEVDDSVRLEAPSMVLEDGTTISVPVPVCVVEADHLLNVHVCKGHFGGATGSMKNLFGFASNVYSTFHGRGDWGLATYERGRQCADLASQPLIREKTRLLISEAVYGTWWHANKPPDRFRNEEMFPGGMPCSLVAGRNPLHHDLVLFDLMRAERDYAPLDEGYDTYPDDWLVACAQEPTVLGVFEHARTVDGTFTARDLAYDYIDYRSMANPG